MSNEQVNLILGTIADKLKFNKNDIAYVVFSRMGLTIGPVTHAGEWALRISEAVNADTYVNPGGGREILESDAFNNLGISLQFLESDLQEYNQRRAQFVPKLSIIDSLMWLGPENVHSQIEHYNLAGI